MKSSYQIPRFFSHSFLIGILGLLVLASNTGVAMAQKTPTSLKLDVDADDKNICSKSPMQVSEFCDYYRRYKADNATDDEKALARNEMIELVRGQVDTFYNQRKEGRKSKVRWFQTVLDFLEIGTATAITIMNGERAKSVVSAALNGLQGERATINKNFEILQTQVLINKMNSNRAEIATGIVNNKGLSSTNYSWYSAKNDLRRYLLAGTFGNALDTLVNETGAEVNVAETELRRVESMRIVGATTAEALSASARGKNALSELDAGLKKDETKDAALATLRSIVTELSKSEPIKQLLEAKGINGTSEGTSIIRALVAMRRELTIVGKEDLVEQINNVITTENNK